MRFLVLTFLFGIPLSGYAQDTKPALPSDGVLVNKLAGMDCWQITVTYANRSDDEKEDASASPVDNTPDPNDGILLSAEIRKVTITTTAPRWHVETVKSKGGTVNQWFDGKNLFVITPHLGASLVQKVFNTGSGGDGTNLLPFKGNTFPDFDWISSQNYRGVQKLGSANCYVFADDLSQAWIDVESKNPVAWRRGTETRTFQHLEPPSQTLTLPAGVNKILEAIGKDTQRMAKPYRPRG